MGIQRPPQWSEPPSCLPRTMSTGGKSNPVGFCHQAPASLGVCTQSLHLVSSIAPSLSALGVQGVEVIVAPNRWDTML